MQSAHRPHLEDLTSADVLLDLAHPGLVDRLAGVLGIGQLARRRHLHQLRCERRLQAPGQVVQLGVGGGKGRFDVGPAAQIEMGDEQQVIEAVVEDQHRVEAQQMQIRQMQMIGRAIRQRLEEPHAVVAEIANQSAREARQPRDMGTAQRLEIRAHGAVGIAGQTRGRAIATMQGDALEITDQPRHRFEPEHAEARHPFAADHALEQEGVGFRTAACQYRDRGQIVSHQPTHHGNQGEALAGLLTAAVEVGYHGRMSQGWRPSQQCRRAQVSARVSICGGGPTPASQEVGSHSRPC